MSGSSLESDLRAAREAKGLSLADIQAETRIPVHILQQFEDGRLVGDPTYNQVYLRAFLKSYAKSVGLPQADVIAAYDRASGGPPAAPPPRVDAPLDRPVTPIAEVPKAPATTPKAAPPPPKAETPKTPAAAVASSPAVVSASRPAPSASTASRVRKPAVPSARRSFDKNWGTITGLFLVLVAVLAGAIWFLVFRGDGDPAEDPAFEPTNETAAAIDSAGVGAGAASAAPQLQTPIRVTVYAAGNGLQNFRVTEEPNERLGHWVEPGDSKAFESGTALVLWGEGGDGFGTDAIVELQGQRWIPTSPVPLRIDAATGQRLLDSLSARPPGAMPAVPGTPGAAE